MSNRKHLATLAAAGVLAAFSGLATVSVQEAPAALGLPLSPVGQLALSPVSQQNAVRAAKSYLDFTAFASRR